MKRLICVTFILLFTLTMAAGLLTGCSEKKDDIRIEDMVTKGNLYVKFPGASDEQKAAMDAYVEDFKKAYPYVTVFVDYPEAFSEEEFVNIGRENLSVLVLPEDQVNHYVSDLTVLMPMEAYGKAFGIDIENMYDGVEKGIVDDHLYFVRMPQFSAGAETDVVPAGLVVSNRTVNPDAAAAFALFYYTPEVPENGIWRYKWQIID